MLEHSLALQLGEKWQLPAGDAVSRPAPRLVPSALHVLQGWLGAGQDSQSAVPAGIFLRDNSRLWQFLLCQLGSPDEPLAATAVEVVHGLLSAGEVARAAAASRLEDEAVRGICRALLLIHATLQEQQATRGPDKARSSHIGRGLCQVTMTMCVVTDENADCRRV